MHILIMNFRTNKYQELVHDLDDLADWMNTVKGLLSKTWLQHSEGEKIGGIYHFDTQENLLNYKNCSELFEFKRKYQITDYQESCFFTAEVNKVSQKNNSPFFMR